MRSLKKFVLLVVVLSCATWCVAQTSSSSSPAQTPAARPDASTTNLAPGAQQPQKPSPAEPIQAVPSQERSQSAPAEGPPALRQASAASFNDVIDRIVDREHFFVAQMRHMHPLVETYIQNMKTDKDLGEAPVSDKYFLGRLSLGHTAEDDSFLGQPGFARRFMDKLTGLYSMKFLPNGFAQMVMLDADFQKRYYDFKFVRREFIGELRCLVIDVQPRENSGVGRFLGRIWVEDQDYNIVRFNGTYSPHPKYSYYLHFDSWRWNLRPGLWLPAYIYSQESDLKYRLGTTLRFKAQTRLWGYDLQHLGKHEEFTQILVDAPQTVRDQSETGQDSSPIQAERSWQHQAEENAIERLQNIGLLAPAGDLDKVLETVVNNLEVTNNLALEPEVRCRVMLTTPLESFTIGHTIVMSRGMIDVLPDEASLAMVLSHELAHIALGHMLDTKMAFNDQMLFPDDEAFERLDFKHRAGEEEAADKRAVELLKNSPYKDKLGSAGLFLKALHERAPQLHSLIRPHLGDALGTEKQVRMAELLTAAPQLDFKKPDQVAALPLGGRVRVDPWSGRAELLKSKPVALTSAREKMPFEVTPFFPFLTRIAANAPGQAKVASKAPEK